MTDCFKVVLTLVAAERALATQKIWVKPGIRATIGFMDIFMIAPGHKRLDVDQSIIVIRLSPFAAINVIP